MCLNMFSEVLIDYFISALLVIDWVIFFLFVTFLKTSSRSASYAAECFSVWKNDTNFMRRFRCNGFLHLPSRNRCVRAISVCDDDVGDYRRRFIGAFRLLGRTWSAAARSTCCWYEVTPTCVHGGRYRRAGATMPIIPNVPSPPLLSET